MRICVVGAGSIGGHVAVLFAEAGHEVSVIELGRLTDTLTPHVDTVYALVKLLAQTAAAEKLCVRAMTREFLDRAVNAVPVGDEPAAVR